MMLDRTRTSARMRATPYWLKSSHWTLPAIGPLVSPPPETVTLAVWFHAICQNWVVPPLTVAKMSDDDPVDVVGVSVSVCGSRAVVADGDELAVAAQVGERGLVIGAGAGRDERWPEGRGVVLGLGVAGVALGLVVELGGIHLAGRSPGPGGALRAGRAPRPGILLRTRVALRTGRALRTGLSRGQLPAPEVLRRQRVVLHLCRGDGVLPQLRRADAVAGEVYCGPRATTA